MADLFTRDELGRFAVKPNGGGVNFSSSEPYPETRDALMKHATSGPSHAPSFGGGTPDIAQPEFDGEKMMSMVGLRAGGHGGEYPRQVAHNIAERFTPDELNSPTPSPAPSYEGAGAATPAEPSPATGIEPAGGEVLGGGAPDVF